MRIRIGAVLPLACLLCAPVAARAQERTPTSFDTTSSKLPADSSLAPREEMKPDDAMSTSGLFLGIVGMLGGAAIGSQIGQSDCPAREVDKGCVGRHAYTGALIAGTVLVPIGVHLANRDRGSLPLSMAVSALAAGLLYYGLKAVPGEPIAMAPFLAAPVQVVTSIRLEKRK
jgi:hypothetical protein